MHSRSCFREVKKNPQKYLQKNMQNVLLGVIIATLHEQPSFRNYPGYHAARKCQLECENYWVKKHKGQEECLLFCFKDHLQIIY